MIHKKQLNTRIIYSLMVPLSIAGFSVGILSIGELGKFSELNIWDIVRIKANKVYYSWGCAWQVLESLYSTCKMRSPRKLV
jgi:hypothetical protein